MIVKAVIERKTMDKIQSNPVRRQFFPVISFPVDDEHSVIEMDEKVLSTLADLFPSESLDQSICAYIGG